MKILFIGNTRLGDAILSTSILNYYSGSNLNITVVCSPLTENIYKNFSNVKDIIAVNKKKKRKALVRNLLFIRKSVLGLSNRFEELYIIKVNKKKKHTKNR